MPWGFSTQHIVSRLIPVQQQVNVCPCMPIKFRFWIFNLEFFCLKTCIESNLIFHSISVSGKSVMCACVSTHFAIFWELMVSPIIEQRWWTKHKIWGIHSCLLNWNSLTSYTLHFLSLLFLMFRSTNHFNAYCPRKLKWKYVKACNTSLSTGKVDIFSNEQAAAVVRMFLHDSVDTDLILILHVSMWDLL